MAQLHDIQTTVGQSDVNLVEQALVWGLENDYFLPQMWGERRQDGPWIILDERHVQVPQRPQQQQMPPQQQQMPQQVPQTRQQHYPQVSQLRPDAVPQAVP